MKKLTTMIFAALIAVTLSVPAWSQTTAPASTAKKDDKKATTDTKDSKKTKKSKKAKPAAKKDTSTTDKKDATKK